MTTVPPAAGGRVPELEVCRTNLHDSVSPARGEVLAGRGSGVLNPLFEIIHLP